MVALNAKTGEWFPSFGTNGIVDFEQNLDQEMDPVEGEIGLQRRPWS